MQSKHSPQEAEERCRQLAVETEKELRKPDETVWQMLLRVEQRNLALDRHTWQSYWGTDDQDKEE